jgi:DNA topoisomerase IB
MARGWESKSVEEQMANAVGNSSADSRREYVSEEVRRATELKRAARVRQIQALELQRENILSQRTSNPGRRAALEAALAHVEAQIQSIN